MNTQAVHKALCHLQHNARWLYEGDNEWRLVGDGVTIDASKLQSIADIYFKSNKLIVSVDRKTGFEVTRDKLTETLNANKGYIGYSFQRVLVTDFNMTAVIELKDMGVARCGIIDENTQAIEYLENESS